MVWELSGKVQSCRQGKLPSLGGSWAASKGLGFPSSFHVACSRQLLLAPAYVAALRNYVSCWEECWEVKIIITCHLFVMLEISNEGLGGVVEIWGLVRCKDWKETGERSEVNHFCVVNFCSKPSEILLQWYWLHEDGLPWLVSLEIAMHSCLQACMSFIVYNKVLCVIVAEIKWYLLSLRDAAFKLRWMPNFRLLRFNCGVRQQK